MPILSKNLCRFCENFNNGDYECEKGHFIDQTDEQGNQMIVTECEDFRGEENGKH